MLKGSNQLKTHHKKYDLLTYTCDVSSNISKIL